MSAAHWARWLAIPVALGLVFAITRTDAVKQARFDFSRGALDQMAADVMAGGSLDRGWVGLYNVGAAERTANGFWFVIDDSGLGRRRLLRFAIAASRCDDDPSQHRRPRRISLQSAHRSLPPRVRVTDPSAVTTGVTPSASSRRARAVR